MGGSEWQRVKDVLAAALDEQPARRPALVDEMCAGDPRLRAEVESLLRAHAEAGTFIEQPAFLGFQPDETPEPNLGRVIGSYYIEECIGRGGMGAVYLARRADREFERRVAIKMIRRGMDSDLVVRRFRHERQILASLDHPHIARLFDGGTTPEGLPYFVMEYVAGTPIDRYADEHCLDTPARIRLCLGVLDAVHHAHEQHIVHRDLKPSNVLVTADGQPKLLDFGIAKILDPEAEGDSTLTALARAMTPEYASPEQVRAEAVTAATDVYALGLLLYELLTGRRPYRLTSRTPDEIARVVCEQDPQRPSAVVTQTETTSLPDGSITTTTPDAVSRTRDGSPELLRQRLSGSLDEIVLKALRKDPAQRYASAAAMADDLKRYLAEKPVSAGRDAWRYRATRLMRRHRATAAVAASILAAVIVTALVVRSNPAEAPATAPARVTQARPAVAVVAFRNLSGRDGDEWLSTAMAEMLTTELAGDGQLRVVPADRVERAGRELRGERAADAPADDLERLRASVGADYLVVGSFATAEQAPTRSLRIDVRVQRPQQDAIAVAGVGDEAHLFALVADAGRELRGRLGLKASSPETTHAAEAAFPRTVEATRLYAEGVTRLRLLDAMAARDLLERADAREPGNPVIQMALASAWAALGYDRRAADAAQKAFDASGGLNREARLEVEARLWEARQNWPKAIEIYRTLWGFFSDNGEYGLRLAAAQTRGSEHRAALETVAALRRLPPAQSDDPRIDIAEAQAHAGLSDYKQELAALQRAIRRAEASGARQVLARGKQLEGRSYYSLGQPAAAEQSLRTALKLFGDAGDKAGVALTLNSLATVLDDSRDLTVAQKMYEESLAISEQIGDRRSMSAALNNLGIIFKDHRRFADARRAHERALALRREIDDRSWTAVSLSNIGVVLFEEDRFSEAAKYYRESLAICREIGDRRGQVRALHNLAVVERETGRLASARASHEESLATRAAIGDRRGIVMGNVELGMVMLALGELPAAKKAEEQAASVAREIKMKSGEAQALFQLAEIDAAGGNFDAARTQHERALVLRREMSETRTVAESQVALAALELEAGRLDEADRRAAEAARTLDGAPGPLRIGLDLVMARLRLTRGDVAGGERHLRIATQAAGRTERVDIRTWLALVGADVDAARGRTADARTALNQLRPILAANGMLLADFEARERLVRLDRREGRPDVDTATRALERDAQARGVGMIVRRVQRVLRAES